MKHLFFRRSIIATVLVAFFWVTGCSVQDEIETEPNANPSPTTYSAAARTSNILSGDKTCPYGGILVETGIDENGNGILDSEEVDKSEPVCHGSPGQDGASGEAGASGSDGTDGSDGKDGSDGLNSLVAIIDEPAGVNCLAGGLRIESGLDANASGVLDAEEVSSTSYVCNGQDGAAGPPGRDGVDGANGLFSTADEPPGTNCATGGLRIDTGLDANRNAILDSEEIQRTDYLCNNLTGGGPGDADTEPPHVVSAGSIGNNEVLVTFSEPVQGGADGAGNPNYFRISAAAPVGGAGTSNLIVTAAELLEPAKTKVKLTTLSQSDVQYTLTVTGVVDEAGNPIAPRERYVDPSTVTFVGTPPAGGELVDTDGDGVTDAAEQWGWLVTISLANGEKVQRLVSSDPQNPDTDNDGVTDRDEKTYILDPRSSDTDSDQLTDYQELNETFSDPFNQDTDADGLADGLEFIFFKTTPILADTDGDQFSDAQELLTLGRNPRIADLPTPRISIGNVSLELDRRFTQVDEEGQETTDTTSTATTLGQSSEQTYAWSDEHTTSKTTETGVNAGFDGKSIQGGVSHTETNTRSHTTSFTQASTQASQQQYENSFEHGTAFDRSLSVTSTIEAANILTDVTLQNVGDTSFTLSNIEITALMPDPLDHSRFVPLASLMPQNPALGDVNLGTGGFVSERGPLVFEATNVFPQRVEDLMKSPRGLIFKLANFDLTDEAGRNFAYASQEVLGRTAGITIDFGDGRLEKYRVATGGTFDAQGRPNGITMDYALGDILGIDYQTSAEQVLGPETGQTSMVETLSQVEEVAESLDENRFWIVISSRERSPLVDFGEMVLLPGDQINLGYVQDKDRDGVYAREEYLYGSSDLNPNTDGCPQGQTCQGSTDTLTDQEEIKDGWIVAVEGQPPIKVYPDPVQPDSDGDGLLDHEEKACGLDPRSRDTDRDGIPDKDELRGYHARDANGMAVFEIPVYLGQVILPGKNKRLETSPVSPDKQATTALGLDMIVPEVPGTDLATVNINYQDPLNGDDFLAVDHPNQAGVSCNGGAGFATDPLNADTDGDGITDGSEIHPDLLIDPNNQLDGARFRDADRDGLPDELENGWKGYVNGELEEFTSNRYLPDTDEDGLPDLIEFKLRTNPSSPDTDGDGISDYEEFGGPGSTLTTVPPGRTKLDQAAFDAWQAECNKAENCSFTLSSSPTNTNPAERDTDDDGLGDNIELNGYAITVEGQSRTVTANPFIADTDGDTWNDGKEHDERTDASLQDTDGDGVNDNVEGTICVGTTCLDPTVRDKKIGFQYTYWKMVADCDAGAGLEEWDFEFWGPTQGSGTTLEKHVDFTRDQSWFLANGDGKLICTGAYEGASACNPNWKPLWSVGPVDLSLTALPSARKREWIAPFGEAFKMSGWIEEYTYNDVPEVQFRWGPDLCSDCGWPAGLPPIHKPGDNSPSSQTVDASLQSKNVSLVWSAGGDVAGCDGAVTIIIWAEIDVNEANQ